MLPLHTLPLFLWRRFADVMSLATFLVMVGVLSPLPLFDGAMPMLLACVAGYAVMQHLPISLALLALLGVGYDAICGLPLGGTATLLLSLTLVLQRSVDRIADQGFTTRYVWFALGLVLASVVYVAVVSVVARALIPLSHTLLMLTTTWLCYPLVHTVLRTLQRRLYRRIWVFLPPEYKPVT